jgi:DNA-binding MarR family transcriptional regulator/GNAT superfamily N-acetyltransferase
MPSPVVAAPPPAGPTRAQVAQVRAFNRFYTNVIGALRDMYLDTPYTLTESRVLFEIARLGTVEVPWLRQELDIDPGYLSRVLGQFESRGLVTRHRSAADARRQEIRATDAGRAAVAELDARAVTQIGALLSGVDCDPVLDAMRVITQALGHLPGAGPAGDPAGHTVPQATLRPLEIGDLGWMLRRHGTLYAAEFGWDATFEGFCAQVVAEYVALRDRCPGRAAAWIAEVDGVPAGSVSCVPDVPGARPHTAGIPTAGVPDGPDGGTTARLRLLLVEPWARGRQLGARLVDRCLDFARAAGYSDIVLLTYDQLAAARRVYQAAGFTLDREHPEDAFGQHMMCQTWSRPL